MEESEQEYRRIAVQRIINAYHRLWSSEDGKKVFADLASVFRLKMPSFLPGQDGKFDPIAGAVRDGQKSVLLHIEEILRKPCRGDNEADVDGQQQKPKVIS